MYTRVRSQTVLAIVVEGVTRLPAHMLRRNEELVEAVINMDQWIEVLENLELLAWNLDV